MIDTVVNTKRYRAEFSFHGGLNCGLLNSRSNGASLLEIKPDIEYKRVLRGLLPNEEKSTFFANAELRVRITKDLWLPLILKYDLENDNFLGFLNVSLNLNAFK